MPGGIEFLPGQVTVIYQKNPFGITNNNNGKQKNTNFTYFLHKTFQDYYFISTSSPGNLHNLDGGYCRTHNMQGCQWFFLLPESTNDMKLLKLPITRSEIILFDRLAVVL